MSEMDPTHSDVDRWTTLSTPSDLGKQGGQVDRFLSTSIAKVDKSMSTCPPLSTPLTCGNSRWTALSTCPRHPGRHYSIHVTSTAAPSAESTSPRRNTMNEISAAIARDLPSARRYVADLVEAAIVDPEPGSYPQVLARLDDLDPLLHKLVMHALVDLLASAVTGEPIGLRELVERQRELAALEDAMQTDPRADAVE